MLFRSVVHAHSSFAGLMVRAGIANRPSRRVVYTPHCFAAERRDISRAARLAFIVAEFALSLNTYKFGACSIHEHRLASRMFAQKGSVYVPNTAPARLAEADEKTTAPQALQPLRIAMLGRVSPQKDPLFFAGVVGGLRSTVPDIQATWIGTGTAALEQHLTDASVSITGWLSSSEAQERLGEADIYVHTAAWEGFPMAILEAHRAGLLIVARDIAALRGDGNEWLGHSPADIVDKVLMLINPDAQIENRTSWSRILESNTPIEQRMRLIELYAPPRNGNGRNIDADGRRQTKSTNATARLRGESVNPA